MTNGELVLRRENNELRLKIQELQRRLEEEKVKWQDGNIKKTGKGDDFSVSRKKFDTPILNP